MGDSPQAVLGLGLFAALGDGPAHETYLGVTEHPLQLCDLPIGIPERRLVPVHLDLYFGEFPVGGGSLPLLGSQLVLEFSYFAHKFAIDCTPSEFLLAAPLTPLEFLVELPELQVLLDDFLQFFLEGSPLTDQFVIVLEVLPAGLLQLLA